MRHLTLPFQLTDADERIGADGITTTEEHRHGVLRLEDAALVVQWRVEREVHRVGIEMRSDRAADGMREVSVPVRLLGHARLQGSGWWMWREWALVIIARDLAAFDPLAGPDGFRFVHPAELVLPVRKADRAAAEEFASELELAIAEGALAALEEGPGGALPGSRAAAVGALPRADADGEAG
ncbi:MAG: hypothetical protein K1X31_03805 [Gemmatimonadaceae bacterium]|nr:hypothetical protein [Gemmatimonadaceae bacterium]